MAKRYVVDNGGVVHQTSLAWRWHGSLSTLVDLTCCGIDLDAAEHGFVKDASGLTVTCIACIVALAR